MHSSMLLFLVLGGLLQPTPEGIRGVDFKGLTYLVDTVPMKIGPFWSDPTDPQHTIGSVELQSVAFGHLAPNSGEAAAVLIGVNGGGKGVLGYGFVYEMRSGRPSLVATFKGGDRTDGGVVRVRIENHELLVSREFGTYACCPEYFVTTWYRLDEKGLTVVRTRKEQVKK